jgi:hypothetical protein
LGRLSELEPVVQCETICFLKEVRDLTSEGL